MFQPNAYSGSRINSGHLTELLRSLNNGNVLNGNFVSEPSALTIHGTGDENIASHAERICSIDDVTINFDRLLHISMIPFFATFEDSRGSKIDAARAPSSEYSIDSAPYQRRADPLASQRGY